MSTPELSPNYSTFIKLLLSLLDACWSTEQAGIRANPKNAWLFLQ